LLVSAGNDGKVRSWDPADAKEFPDRYGGHTAAVTSLAFNPDGTILATADKAGHLLLHNLHADRIRALPFPLPIHALSFAPDSRHLAVATGNSAVYILRLARGE
jgi:WD40 repeat protein